MPVTRLSFLFDFISPNAYIAWSRIHELAGRHQASVDPVPLLFAGLLSAKGAVGPAEVRDKWRWMIRDIVRKGAALGLTLEPPRSHPFNPLLALRLASLPLPDVERRRLIDALFGAVWAGGPGVTDPDVVADVLNAAGFDGPALVRDAGQPRAKARLREQTERAAAEGVFGVPSVIVRSDRADRLFWGYDDFPQVDAYLAGNDSLDETVLKAWEAVRPTAVRRESRNR